ncbi:MAG: protein-L-isoaspartate(D-aspartate) O-methyltransferase [Rhizobiaceae bacterium]
MTSVGSDRERFAAFLLRARSQGVPDNGLFKAVEAVPRVQFVPEDHIDVVWTNQSLPIPCGEAIEAIDLQAKVLGALEIIAGQRVLEIGTGSGFTAAVMARMGAKVRSIDRYKTLAAAAQERFAALGFGNAVATQADGSKLPGSEGPFDRIVAWAAFAELPRKYVDLLATGGIMVAPVGPGEGVQQLARLTKVGSRFEREDIARVRMQPLIPGVAAAL